MNFLKPTKKKLAIFFGLIIFVAVWGWFFFTINELDIAGILLVPLISAPIEIFDTVTFAHFEPRCNGALLCFPTEPQIIFIIVFDLVMLYVISCAVVAFTRKKNPKFN